MPPKPTPPLAALPHWLIVAATVAIVFHFSALTLRVLAARSGPWTSPFGPTPMEPPAFAAQLNSFTNAAYLEPLGMSHDYQFVSNRTTVSAVKVDFRLLDSEGKVVKTISWPDPHANFWVRQRQQILALGLGNDQTVQAVRKNVAAAPGQQLPSFTFFFSYEGLDKPRDLYEAQEPPGDAFGPTNGSLLLAKAYVRKLQREHDGQVQVVRRSRNPVYPVYLFVPPPPDAYNELICNFGNGEPKKYLPKQATP